MKLFACAMALEEHRRDETLIEEVASVAGAASVIGAAPHRGERVLVF